MYVSCPPPLQFTDDTPLFLNMTQPASHYGASHYGAPSVVPSGYHQPFGAGSIAPYGGYGGSMYSPDDDYFGYGGGGYGGSYYGGHGGSPYGHGGSYYGHHGYPGPRPYMVSIPRAERTQSIRG